MHADKDFTRLLDGKLVIIKSPGHDKQTVPLFCSCCGYPMRTMEDCIAYRKNAVCYHCDNRWSNSRDVKLQDKVYPDKTTEEWSEYLSFRQIIGRNIFTLK